MNCTPHAGHQRGAGKVDHPGTGGCGHVRAHCRDLVAIDEDLPACVRAWIDAVEHLRGAEEERVGGRWRGDGRSEDCDQRRRVPK